MTRDELFAALELLGRHEVTVWLSNEAQGQIGEDPVAWRVEIFPSRIPPGSRPRAGATPYGVGQHRVLQAALQDAWDAWTQTAAGTPWDAAAQGWA